MKGKTLLLLTFLVLSSIPLNQASIEISQSTVVPAPEFIGLNNTGTPEGSYIFEINTTVLITYEADRYDVEGLMLLGSGSNLTEDYISEPELILNFTKVSSFRDKSTFEVSLELTNYTYFYARSWYGNFDNGTKEGLDIFAGQPGHQLWVDSGALYPTFDLESSNVREVEGSLYAPLYSNVTLTYQVRNSVNDSDEVLTLVFGNNETEVLNASISNFVDPEVNMTRTDYQFIGDYNFSIFKFEFNLSQPVLYFSAYNNQGWERELEDPDEPVVHRLTNGFKVNHTFSEPRARYTNAQKIAFNFTTFNQTEDMEAGFQWRYFQNASSEEPVVDWQYTYNMENQSYELVDNSRDGTIFVNSTVKMHYDALINQTFINDTVVEIKYFVTWDNNRYNWSSNLISLTIFSGITVINYIAENNTIWNAVSSINKTIIYAFSTPAEEINVAELIHLRPQNQTEIRIDLLDKLDENHTIDFTFDGVDNETAIEGMHVLIINVTNSLNLTTTKRFVYYIDTTDPTGSLSIDKPSNFVTTDGQVTASFTYADETMYDKGIELVEVDWGNGIVMNVTGLNEITYRYLRSGTYTISLIVTDKAGNQQEFVFDESIQVNLPKPKDSDVANGPIVFIPIFLGIIALLAVKSQILNNRQSKLE